MKRLSLNRDNATWLLLIILLFTLIPWLGCSLFHTKGEPREAIVAVSMLQSGNWILPVSNGDVIPYKPPLLAWCIALISILAGHVTEFSSRLPSALAMIGLLIWTYRFFSRRIGWGKALATSLICLTAFEVFRSGVACRVDMLLTFFMTGALYSLYDWWEREFHGQWWIVAVLMMSGAMLTKGPVGILLPCAVVWTFALVEGSGWWKVTWRLTLVAVASLLLPAWWYIAAYQQGGEEFLNLALEENIGRLTGTMSYESHVNPWWYNILTLITGFLPWTLLLLLSIFPCRYKSPIESIKKWGSRLKKLRHDNPTRFFSLMCVLLIFIFYCIPKSKRSVYLLPIYPFLAMFIADYISWLIRQGHRSIKIYAGIIATVALLAAAVFIFFQTSDILGVNIHNTKSIDTRLLLHGLSLPANWYCWPVLLLSACTAFLTISAIRKGGLQASFVITIVATVTLYWVYQAAYQPAVINGKSDKRIAETIQMLQPDGPVYAHVETDMLRMFTANFYLDNHIRPFELDMPQEGFVIVGDKDIKAWLPVINQDYILVPEKKFRMRSCDLRQPYTIYRFKRLRPN